MEQRRLRLGDILDDYCPRERRLTNHAVVAMIEEDVKQTRCTTCDAEHAYKGGKVPPRRKKETTGGALQGSARRPARRRRTPRHRADSDTAERRCAIDDRASRRHVAPAAEDRRATADADAVDDRRRVADGRRT